MTVESSVNDGITYSGNDSTTVFSFPFKVNLTSQVEVIIRDSNEIETTKTVDVDFTVTNQNVEGSGSLTYPITGDPLPTGSKITITPAMDYKQATDIKNQGRFAPKSHEDAFDNLMMHIKELKGLVDRAVKFKKSSELTGVEFDQDPVDNKLLAWDGVTGKIKNAVVTDTVMSAFWEAILARSNAIIGDPGTEDSGITIGGVTYESTFKVSDIDGSNLAQTILHRHSTTLEPLIVGARSNSNTSAHADVVADQCLFSIYAAGFAGSDYKLFGQICIGVDDSGTISNTSAPGKMEFKVTPDGSTAPVTFMSVDNAGKPTFTNFEASATSRGPDFLPEFILHTNNTTDANNDIDFTVGKFRFDDGSGSARLVSALTKRLDAAWAVGDGEGGLDTGSKANSTYYYLHGIYNPTTDTADIVFSASATSPTLPSGYTKSGRIGTVSTDGSGNLYATSFFYNIVTDRQQITVNQSGAVANGGTAMAFDDTPPQSGEGDQYFSVGHTPFRAKACLDFDIVLNGHTQTSNFPCCALFRDSETSAFAATSVTDAATTSNTQRIKRKYFPDSVATSTYKVRAGGTAGNFTMNGQNSGRIFGGIFYSSITITEDL